MRRSRLESVEDLTVAEKIGQGKTSEVFLARNDSNKAFAMKKFHNRSSNTPASSNNNNNNNNNNNTGNAADSIPVTVLATISAGATAAAEAQILFDLGNHPRIPRVYLTDTQHIVMELSENGEIFNFIQHGGSLLDESLGLFYLRQLLEVIEFVHENGYAHRDIKPENILLDEEFNLKLTDFGLSCAHNETEEEPIGIESAAIGTVGYMAPELVRLAELNERGCYSGTKVDVFSMGVVLFSLVNGFPPFLKQASITDPYYKFFVEKRTNVYWSSLQRKFGKIYSQEFTNLITGMLAFNPQERFDLDQVKFHPWLKRTSSLSNHELFSRMSTIKEVILENQKYHV